MKLKLVSLLSLALATSSCVTFPNTNACAVSGYLASGAFCEETLTGVQTDLDMDQTLTLIERGSVILTADDWTKIKTFMDKACYEMGPRCIKEGQADAAQNDIGGLNLNAL